MRTRNTSNIVTVLLTVIIIAFLCFDVHLARRCYAQHATPVWGMFRLVCVQEVHP